MDPLAGVPHSFKRLKEIAGEFKPDELNDGEASFLRERVDECLRSIRFEISGASEISTSRIDDLMDEVNTIDKLYQDIFTPENERSFAPIREAHQSLDELKIILQIRTKVPKLAKSLLEIEKLTTSFKLANTKKYLYFGSARNQFVGTDLEQDQPKDYHIRRGLEAIENFFGEINKQLDTSVKELSDDERSLILRQLEVLQKEAAPLYMEIGTGETEDLPSVFRYASEIFVRSEQSPDEKKLTTVIDDSMGTIVAEDFELLDSIKRVTVGFNEFDPLVDSGDLREIGQYLVKNADSFLEKVVETPTGEKSFYLRKEGTGLTRTIQVILPEGKSRPEDLLFVIQLKQHGVTPLDEKGFDLFMKRINEGLADPLMSPEKDLPVIGAGGFKVAKHSLTLPYTAIKKGGEIDTEQIIHTTTLTPHVQSKSRLESCVVTSHYYGDKAEIEKTVKSLSEKGVEDIQKDVKYHKEFQGPGVLPLIGSSLYEGVYRYDDTGLIDAIFGTRRECKVHFTKSNIVTIKCDGDLDFNPERTFTLTEKKKIAADIIEGMIRIHRKGYKHGDMKPGNVLYKREDGEIHAYLADFGFSGEWDSVSESGTPHYIPVNFIGLPKKSLQYDLYATGLTLLSLLSNFDVYTPSPSIWLRTNRRRNIAGFALMDDQTLNEMARLQGLSPEVMKEVCEKIMAHHINIRYLIPNNQLKQVQLNPMYLKVRSPLFTAFVKTFFASYAEDDSRMTEEERAFLFGAESHKIPLEGADLTVPLLENLLKEIMAIKSEDDINLGNLLTRVL